MTQPNHDYIRPGQVSPAPDACVQCGRPEAVHAWPPLETEDQARELAPVTAVYRAMRYHTGRIDEEYRQRIDGMCSEMIFRAMDEAGAGLGAYDRRIVNWLGSWEPQTCAVFAGLIRRAYAAGQASIREAGL